MRQKKSPATFYDRKLETLSRTKLGESQDRRLRAMMREMLESNGFYRAKLREAGIRKPVPLSRLSDIPFTTKSELTKDQVERPPFGTNLTFPMERYTRMHQTSGTTGTPIRWLDTPESWLTYCKEWGHVYCGAGVGADDRVFVAFSFGP